MKRGEILFALRELQATSRNIRGWLDDVDAKIADLTERLKAPADAQSTAQPEQAEAVKPVAAREETPYPTVQFDGDPVAPSINTLVSPKQLGMIRALARECGVDYEVECLGQLNCKPEDLGKRAASAFIDYLKALQERGAAFQKVS